MDGPPLTEIQSRKVWILVATAGNLKLHSCKEPQIATPISVFSPSLSIIAIGDPASP